MKKFFCLSLLFAFVFLIVSPASASNYYDWIDSVKTAADELIAVQNDNGSFDWENDGSASSYNVGYNNTQGATARGLVAAYNVTGNSAYLQAANKVADYLIGLDSGNIKYNKDMEFIYELAAAGGRDYTTQAESSALTYFQNKIDHYSSQSLSGAKALRQYYLDKSWVAPSGVMNGTKLWMLGEWGHVGQLLGNKDIVTGYTGFDMAQEMGSLVLEDFDTIWDYETDDYIFLGLVGVLEGSFFGDIANNGTVSEKDLEQEALDVLLSQPLGGWQDTGYATFVKSLFDIYDSTTLISWIKNGHYTPSIIGTNLEARGEALLGLSSAPIPEPATLLLFGVGLLGIAGVSRRKRS